MSRPIAILWMRRRDGVWLSENAYTIRHVEFHIRYCRITETPWSDNYPGYVLGYIPHYVEWL